MNLYLTGIPDRAECFRLKEALEEQGHTVTTSFDATDGQNPRTHIDTELRRVQAVHDASMAEGGAQLVVPRDYNSRLDGQEWEHVRAEVDMARRCKMPVVFPEKFIAIPAEA